MLSSPRQPTALWPKAPDFALDLICLRKIIYKNYFIVKFIKMYFLIFTWIVGSIYLVLPIFIEKKFEQKIYFSLLKIKSIFFKEGKSNFFYSNSTEITEIIFSTSRKKFKIFLFILFEKKKTIGPRHTPVQGCRLSSIFDHSILIYRHRWHEGEHNTKITITFTAAQNSSKTIVKSMAASRKLHDQSSGTRD